jgi:hypothetical protein
LGRWAPDWGDDMVHRRVIRGLAALAVLTTMVACGDDDEGSSATTTAADEGAAEDEGGQAVELTAIDYGYENVPDDLSAGLVELSFANQGKVDHEAAFVEIGDTPLDQFLDDFPPVLEGGPFPEYAEHVAVPIETPGGEDGEATFLLAEGTYALLCALTGDAEAPPAPPGEDPVEGAPHYTKGMATTVEVGPGSDTAELPEADGGITAMDYDFEPDIEAGDTTVNFVNKGPKQVHFASVSVFPEGTDAAAAEEAFAALLALEEDAVPPEGVPLPEDVGFSGVFSADLGGQFTLPDGFEAGRTYVLACFIQDRAGGPPHAIGQQMYTTFTVE